jgi:hypothetical protein
MCQACCNTAEVADEMYISVNTVKTHLGNIYQACGGSSQRSGPPGSRASAHLTCQNGNSGNRPLMQAGPGGNLHRNTLAA